METTLGLGLFERRPSGLVLNRAGARLAASARGMRERARIFEQVTASVRTSGSGLARITAPETVAYLYDTFTMLADVLNNFVSDLRPDQSAAPRPQRVVSR